MSCFEGVSARILLYVFVLADKEDTSVNIEQTENDIMLLYSKSTTYKPSFVGLVLERL